MKNYRDLARHISEEIKFIDSSSIGLSFTDFDNNPLIKRAFVRSLEIIGETVKNMPTDILELYPEVEWKNIAKTRDKLIHHYFGVDYEIVWDRWFLIFVKLFVLVDYNITNRNCRCSFFI